MAVIPRLVSALALVATLTGGAACFATETAAITTTICELDAHPARYTQKVVRIRVRIETSPPNFLQIAYDEHCLRHALRVAGPDSAAHLHQVRALEAILLGRRDGIVGTEKKSVRATITGLFVAKQTLGVHAFTIYPRSVERVHVHYGEKSLMPKRP
jgi:hypothetical protein